MHFDDDLSRMRITVDIEEDIIADAMALTGEKNKSPAIAKAVENFVKWKRAKEFGKRLLEGHYDYPLTNDEIESVQVVVPASLEANPLAQAALLPAQTH